MKRNPSSGSALLNIGRRYLLRHPWQSSLMILGIALGVAVVVAIDLANASAETAFRLSTEALTGKATHQISGGPQGVDEKVYASLLNSGWDLPAAPLVSAYISSPQLGGLPMQLLGVDPFADSAFRDFWGEARSLSTGQLASFLAKPRAVVLSNAVAERYGLKPGDALEIDVAGRKKEATLVGVLTPADSLSQRTLAGVVLADISSAQELTDQKGYLTRIDLILPEDDTGVLTNLQSRLPAGYQVSPAADRSSSIEQMTAAFRMNLTALSLLAMVVGLFLIYNTMTFSVVQRRELFGTLRCLGATRQDIFLLVTGEALLAGLVGSGLGIGLGILLGRVTVGMVSQTINDLYFTTTVQAAGLPSQSLLFGGLLGILATLFTAALPAWEAASVPPRAALMRSGLESGARRSILWTAMAGIIVIGMALALFRLPSKGLIPGLGGTLLAVFGMALVSSGLVVLFFRLARLVTRNIFGLAGKLAPRNLLNALSRTVVAAIALMVAVAVSVGVTIMIDSFRHTVVVWLDQTLQSDIYISAPAFTSTTPSDSLNLKVLPLLSKWPGVNRVDMQRSTAVQSNFGPLILVAIQNPQVGMERQFLSLSGPRETVWDRLQNGSVLISEPLASRLGIAQTGQTLRLSTSQGWKEFPVIGIYYDYASSEGALMMALSLYQKLWADPAITAIGLHLAPGYNPDQVARSLQDGIQVGQALEIRANSTLRNEVLTVFDRTFAITIALRLLATMVAFVGVLSALFLLQIERQREVGILRALGLTGGQLRRVVFLETGIMGLVSGILALPTGLALALILIYVINKRSFGWTLQLAVDPWVFVQAVLVALAAALLAGVYPAWRLSRMSAAGAIRYE